MPALTLTLTESTVAVLNRLVAETGLTPDEVARKYILTCQSTPRGEGVVITYDV